MLTSSQLAIKSVGAIIISCIARVVYRRVFKNSHSRLPPSPPSDPFVDHTLRFPVVHPWLTFSEWGKTIGDVFTVKVLGRVFVIVNSATAARELLNQRGANTSSRPHFYTSDLIGLGSVISMLPYGERFKWQRRLFQQYFSQQEVSVYIPTQEQEVQALLKSLLSSPEQFIQSTKRLASILALKAAYGESFLSASFHDDLLDKFEKVAEDVVAAGNSGGTIVDLLPALRYVPIWFPLWFPGVSALRFACEVRKLIQEIMDIPVDELRLRRAQGKSERSFISSVLDDQSIAEDRTAEHEQDIKSLGIFTHLAAFDTTSSIIMSFYLMMCLNPDVMRRAQSKIDEVTEAKRLPTLDDRSEIPYIDALVKELYRFLPPAPMGLPHFTTSDEYYKEWIIPRGSTIISNIWSMMKDEKSFPSPEIFSPELHIRDDNTGQTQAKEDPSELVFGFGRRVCPGRYFADATIWLTVSNVLAVFDIKPRVDSISGEEVLPEALFTSGFASCVKPFECIITPRSDKHMCLLAR